VSVGIGISRVGMCAANGLSAVSACAAIRAGIPGFADTAFIFDGDWIQGAPVPLDRPWRGREKLLRMAESALRDCMGDMPSGATDSMSLIVVLAEEGRAGQAARLDDSFAFDLEARSGRKFGAGATVLRGGRVGGVAAIEQAANLLQRRNGARQCLVIGVDSFLHASTLRALHAERRLLTASNSDGFIPGEAAAALLLEPAGSGLATGPVIHGWGFGKEAATIRSEEPLKAAGLTGAIKETLARSGLGYEALDYRICDANGEQYVFKEAALALTRTLRIRKPEFDIWHPADCIGEVGAATVPCCLAVAWMAALKNYAPGPGLLAHFGNDDGSRAALAIRTEPLGRRAA
jgi:3-oxoacyl-[acyl-carrier-protein] synthase-1